MSIFDLTSAIRAVSVDITVTRYEDAVVLDGLKQIPTSTTFSTKASIQPLSAEDLQQLPEGMSAVGTVRVFCLDALQIGSTQNGNESDRFDYKGITYQVESVMDWSDLGNYYEAIATRVNR